MLILRKVVPGETVILFVGVVMDLIILILFFFLYDYVEALLRFLLIFEVLDVRCLNYQTGFYRALPNLF